MMVQGLGLLDAKRQLQPRFETLGQGEPLMRLGGCAIGLVERAQQGQPEALGQGRTRQAPHIGQAAAAQAFEHGAVL